MDYFVPNKDIKAATQSQQCRCFANDFDIKHYYDVGNMGVEHALLPEQGIVTIGDLILVQILILALMGLWERLAQV